PSYSEGMAWEVAVVDGASASRRHLEIALTASGYKVVGWGNTETARIELGSIAPPLVPPRLLIVELVMDGMDGFDLLAWAKDQWRTGVELMATTGLTWGYVSLAHIVRERFGARFLQKPFLRSEAVQLVEKAIGPACAPPATVPPEWRIG